MNTARPGWWVLVDGRRPEPVEAWGKDGHPAVPQQWGLAEIRTLELRLVVGDQASLPRTIAQANQTLTALEAIIALLREYEMDPWGRHVPEVLAGIAGHRAALERWKKKREPEEAVETLAKQEPLAP